MSWAKAKRRLASVVEAVDTRAGAPPAVATISSLANHRARAGAKFKHRKEANEEERPSDRGFWFDVVDVHFRGPMHHGDISNTLANRIRASVVLNIFYSKDVDASSMIDDAVADYAAVMMALLHPTARGSLFDSRIIGIALGGEELGKATFSKVDGGVIMRIGFFCEYTNKFGDES